MQLTEAETRRFVAAYKKLEEYVEKSNPEVATDPGFLQLGKLARKLLLEEQIVDGKAQLAELEAQAAAIKAQATADRAALRGL